MAQHGGKKQDVALLILRAVVGIIFVAHGWPKLMDGASGTAQFFGQAGIPVPGRGDGARPRTGKLDPPGGGVKG